MYPVYVNTAGLDPSGKYLIFLKNIAEKTLKKRFIFQ